MIFHLKIFQNIWQIKDKRLNDWKLYSKYIVNRTEFDKKIAKVELLEKQGVEKEKLNIVILALDYLAHVNKLFGRVLELEKELDIKKNNIMSDITKIRGVN